MNVTAVRRSGRVVGARLDRLSDNRFAALALLPGLLLVGLVVVPPVAGVFGLSLFTVSSLLGGLAHNGAELIAARTVQGIGGAILAPATLSLITTTFTEADARRRPQPCGD